MNPQQPPDGQGGPLPGQGANPQQPQAGPPQPYVIIPGQGPQSVAPLQTIAPDQQQRVEHSPYEFILNPAQQKNTPKIPLNIGGSSTLMKRIIIASVGLLLLIIIGTIVSSLASSGSKDKSTALIAVAQQQTEIVRIAKESEQYIVDQKTQNFANSVQISQESASNQLLAYLKSNGTKVDPKVLALKQNTQDDAALTSARANSTYDTTFTSIMQKDLNTYGSLLKTAYAMNPGPKGQKLLGNLYDGEQLLLTQSN